LRTTDGESISAIHVVGARSDLCMVVVHGFTGSWREERVQRVITGLLPYGDVIAIDMRGHGQSSGVTTMGHLEVLDVAAAVAWGRELGYAAVVTVGFSLGGAVVLREAALAGPVAPVNPGDVRVDESGRVDAVVSVSAPAFWYYRGTKPTRLAHRLVMTRSGRAVMRAAGTRITSDDWTDPLPPPPYAAAAVVAVPLLVVHGDVDRYFPLEHPRAIHSSAVEAGGSSELWIVPGFDHAETAVSEDTLDRIGRWVRESVAGLGS
jgi:pimeloyl-ACP methyl ester carboxylesterase